MVNIEMFFYMYCYIILLDLLHVEFNMEALDESGLLSLFYRLLNCDK